MKTVTKTLQVLMVLLLLAFAFQTKAQTTLFTEGWETASIGTTPPAGWAVNQLGYGNWLSWVSSGSYPSALPFEGTKMTDFNSYNASAGYKNQLYRTTAISTTGYGAITVDFAEYNQTVFTGGDGITIQWSTNGTTWTSAGTNWSNYASTAGWVIHTQALPAGANNQATLYIAFLFTSQWGYDVYLDLAHVKGAPLGNITGTVKNCYDNTNLSGVSVSCGGVGPVLTSAAGVYTINGISAGSQPVSATKTGFSSYSGTATIVGSQTITYNFCMQPIPATLAGMITDCANNAPIIGAKITCNATLAYSVQGGLYSSSIFPGGTYNVLIQKTGFLDTTILNVVLSSGVTTTLNMCLRESINTPNQPFTAALNGTSTAVNLDWGVPTGKYELLYDDGKQDTNTVWASANNLNAVKFTPIAYPVSVVGGSVNIGQAYDYANGTTLASLIPFTMQVYDATGTGGTPGTALGTPVTITPTTWGWNSFTIAGVNITSGNYYLVMKQAGVPPTACRLAVDTTTNALRSWSKFASGTGAVWLPASGNFMIRSIANGAGGPPENPVSVTGYQVYRLFLQDVGNPASWIPVAAPLSNTAIDNSWPSLPDSAYIWAVKAHFGGTRWSNAIFSNYLGKNRNVAVTVNVTLTCAANSLAGSTVTLSSIAPFAGQFSYTATTDANGVANFPAVAKAPYNLIVSRSGYQQYSAAVSIYASHIYNVTILQQKQAPTNMTVNNKSLFCHWTPPGPIIYAFADDFSSSSFTTHGWSNPTGYWAISTIDGNPVPAAEFSWTTYAMNYSATLITPSMSGSGAPNFKLKYDIFLSDFAGDGNEQFDVEIQVGAGAWTSLKHYANQGNIDWTSETIDLAAYTNSTFKIRFNAHGTDSYNINWWDIDNVSVVTTVPDPKPCILAYNVYLNGILDGVATDTTYTIPGAHCVYGTTYTACVKAVYGSGESYPSCAPSFVDRWLCTPTNFAGQPLESTAYLTWSKPACGGQLVNYIFDSGVAWNFVSITAGYNIQMGNYFPLPPTTAGLVMAFDICFSQYGTWTAQTCVVTIYNAAHTIIGASDPFVNTAATYPSFTWVHVTCTNGVAFTGPFYGLIDYYSPTTPIRNGMGLDGTTTTYDPNGLAWTIYNGAWATAVSTFAYPAPETWEQRVTCFVYGKDKAGELVTYGPSPKEDNVVAAPAAANMATTEKVSIPVGDPPSSPNSPNVVTLLGYNLTRNGNPLPYINNPNQLSYYDNNLNPGIYTYYLTSYWDVTPVQPLHDNSAQVGPVIVTINYGRPLPFYEPWDMGTFDFNVWTHVGNWSINAGLGNPAPCADFSWQPGLTNYNDTLQSVTLSAGSYSCAKIYFDFDYKLIDRNHTGHEFLRAEQLLDGVWKKVDEFSNNGDVAWTSKHYELKQTMGKAFKIRFRAYGANSLDILHWYVDNIAVYAVCNRPTALTYTESHNTVNLSWTVPSCKASGPPAQWIHWDDGVNNDAIGTGAAIDFYIAGHWTPNQISQLAGGSVTKIAFYPSSSGAATYRARIWQGASANMIVDQAVPTVTLDTWNTVSLNTPSLIDVSQDLWIGMDVNASGGYPAGCDAGPAVDGSGDMMYYNGAWVTLISLNPALDYNWNIQGYVETVKGASQPVILASNPLPMQNGKFASSGHTTSSGINAIHNTGSYTSEGLSILKGYNVYRTDSTGVMATSHKIASVTGTTYTDVIPLVGWGTYKYNVTAVMNDSVSNTFLCESPNSDTINVLFPHVGIMEIGNGQIMIYPNPATDNVNVKSDYTITSIEVMNYTGQTVYRNTTVNQKLTQFNVSNLQSGIYFVKLTTEVGTVSTKITVTR